jgi:hypothetical protein
MPYRREVVVEQGPLVDRFVKHLIHHRSLKPWLVRTKVKSPFWAIPVMPTSCKLASTGARCLAVMARILPIGNIFLLTTLKHYKNPFG